MGHAQDGMAANGIGQRNGETASLELLLRRLDGLQNNVSGVNRRLVTLEGNLANRVGTLEARMAELEGRTEELAECIRALSTGVNSLILLVERIAKPQGLKEPPLMEDC